MVRKTMTREVTKTTITVAKMEMKKGNPVAVPLPNRTFIGNINVEKAQRLIEKDYNYQVTVLEVNPNTKIYEMSIEQFIEMANVKQAESDKTKEPKAQVTKSN